MADLYDVLAVNLGTRRVRVLAGEKTKEDADAFANIAVIQRGVEEEFYPVAAAGRYRDGDPWEGS